MKDIQMIKAEQLFHHPNNPRKDLGDLTELSESIRKNGIMQNLTIVADVQKSIEVGHPAYLVVIGNRRLEAGKLAGLEEFPCVISEMSEREQLATMLEENMQRSDLTYLEQAQGFQLMLDLGETVQTISEKTGFSRKTIRGRLDLMKLDQDKLKDACTRQISLADLEKLSAFHTDEFRDEAMGYLGKDDFDWRVRRLLTKEKATEALPWLKAQLKKLKAKELSWSETYGGKWDSYAKYTISECSDKSADELNDTPNKSVGYRFDVDNDSITMYHPSERAKAKKKSKAEAEREAYIKATWDEIQAMAKTSYELRREFVLSLRVTKDNEKAMLRGFVAASLCHCYITAYGCGGIHFADLEAKVTEREKENKYVDCDEIYDKILALYDKHPKETLPMLVYGEFADNNTRDCTGYSSSKSFPDYSRNRQLEAIYDWLVSCGYKMSEEEKQMIDGTHPVYKDKDKKEDPVEPELVEDDPEEEQDEDELLDEGVSEALEEIYDDADSGEKSVGKNDE